MSDSENSDSDTAAEECCDDKELEEEEREFYIDEDDFWDVSETEDEIDESTPDSNNKGKN